MTSSVFPARAGMIPPGGDDGGGGGGIPRESGDDPSTPLRVMIALLYSPRERG